MVDFESLGFEIVELAEVGEFTVSHPGLPAFWGHARTRSQLLENIPALLRSWRFARVVALDTKIQSVLGAAAVELLKPREVAAPVLGGLCQLHAIGEVMAATDVDLADLSTRERLGPAAKEIFESITEMWGLSATEREQLVPGIAVAPISEDNLRRVGHLIAIATALKTVYNDAFANRWITLAHTQYGGRRALDYLTAGGEPAFSRMRAELEAFAAGNL
jgi:hypothetical protein